MHFPPVYEGDHGIVVKYIACCDRSWHHLPMERFQGQNVLHIPCPQRGCSGHSSVRKPANTKISHHGWLGSVVVCENAGHSRWDYCIIIIQIGTASSTEPRCPFSTQWEVSTSVVCGDHCSTPSYLTYSLNDIWVVPVLLIQPIAPITSHQDEVI